MMIPYEDLLTIPYKVNGRDKSGMDCYGLTIECMLRAGKDLHDVVYASMHVSKDRLADYMAHLNVKILPEPVANCGIQCEYNGELHIGFMLDKRTTLHMTYDGVRVTPVVALKKIMYFEVI